MLSTGYKLSMYSCRGENLFWIYPIIIDCSFICAWTVNVFLDLDGLLVPKKAKGDRGESSTTILRLLCTKVVSINIGKHIVLSHNKCIGAWGWNLPQSLLTPLPAPLQSLICLLLLWQAYCDQIQVEAVELEQEPGIFEPWTGMAVLKPLGVQEIVP